MQVSAPTTRPASIADDFRITARALARIADTARFGVLTTEQHARLDGGSRQKVTRLLQGLVAHKLLRRLDRDIAPFLTSFFDTRPRAFGVTPKGLRLLADAGMPINVTPKRAQFILAHEIECAEVMFAVSSAVATHGGCQLIDQPELASTFPAVTLAHPKPLRLQAEAQPRDFPHLHDIFNKPTPIAIEPDRLFAIALPDNTGWSFALELDRGTEDITAKRVKGRATFFRKALGYTSAWSADAHLRQWGAICKSFRVLVVTTNSETRIANMIATLQYVGAPPGLFLFASPARLAAHGALGPAWRSAKRDGISILERA